MRTIPEWLKRGRLCFNEAISTLTLNINLSSPEGRCVISVTSGQTLGAAGAVSGWRGGGHSQVLEGVFTQVTREPLRDVRLEKAAWGPPERPAQDLHTLQGVQHLETPLQRDEKQAAVHTRALQRFFPNLSQVNNDVAQLLKEWRKSGLPLD